MDFSPKKKTSNLLLLIASFAIVSLILWNTNSFFKKFKEEERHKMEIWATAQSEFLSLPVDADPGNLHIKIFQNNTSTPMILVNKDSTIKVNNMPGIQKTDTAFIHGKLTNSSRKTNLSPLSTREKIWPPSITGIPKYSPS